MSPCASRHFRQQARIALALLCMALLVACAPGANGFLDVADPAGGVAGFWRGLWHGLIAPITFALSLFSESTEMYEVHNNGGWYNLGFLLGMSCVFGGGGASSRGWSRPTEPR